MRSLNALLRSSLLVIVALVSAAEVKATTLYVNPNGSDANDGTSFSQAFQTIKKAASVARSGDRVLIAAGQYLDSVNIIGKQGTSQLQLIASEPGKVVISGQVNIVDSNGIVFSGLRFSGNADRFLTWQGSYDGTITNCQFLRGRNALLIKSGSLTLDQCELSDFAGDGIEVDGETKLLVSKSQISGCQGSAIKVLKNARVALDGSNISDNVGDGVRVAVTTDSIPVTRGSCDCTGTTPQSMRREAYDLLADVSPQTGVYRQAIADARSAINSSLSPSLWEDEWKATVSGGPTIYDKSKEAIELLNAVYTDNIDFFISGDEVVVNQPFKLNVKVLGAEIAYGSLYDVPVTTSFKVANERYEPWGAHGKPVEGNVNDNQNPRSFETNRTHGAGSRIKVKATSWVKVNNSYSGSENEHWREYMTVASNSNSSNLVVLKDGDAVPNLAGFGGQASAASFLTSYIENGRIKLDKNQAIFLFELGTTNLSSPAADFQDLVILITLRANNTAITADEAELIKQAILLLLEADKNLASCAMNAALCAGGDPDALAEAESFFYKALRETAAEHYVQASQDYKTAWEAAQKALANPTGSGTLSSTSPQPPSGWAAIPEPMLIVSSSTLTGNNSGTAMLTAGSFASRNSDFSQNKQWGVRLRGAVTLDNCTINTNGVTGVWLEDGSSATLTVSNLSVVDNVEHGLFVKNSDLAFDATKMRQWAISGSKVVIAGEGSDLSFASLTVSGGTTAAVSIVDGNMKASYTTFSDSGFGVSATNSNLDLYDCTLSGNTVGLHSDNNTSLVAQRSKISDNAEWGVKLSGPGSFDDTTISGNGTGGVELTNTPASGLSLTRTSVTDNNTYGLYCSGSTQTFDAANFGGLSLSGHDYQIYGDKASDLSFVAFAVSGGSKYAVYVTNSTLSANDSTFTDAVIGLGSYQNSSCVLDNCMFGANSSFGLHISGNASVLDCTIEGNSSGLLFERTDGSHTTTLSDNTIKDNTEVGVYASESTMTFDTTTLGGTTIIGSKTVFAGFKSSLIFDGITVSGGSQYGIANYSSNVAVNNCTLSANGTGLYSDNGCLATGSTFSGNTATGASVLGAATFSSCVFEKNPNGLQVSNDTTGAVNLVSSEIKDNTLYGVWFDSCTLTFDATMQADWSVQNNGANFGATGSTLTFSGFTISNGTTYGVVSEKGTLNLTDCTLTANGTGALIDAASTLSASGTKFTGNSVYGAYLGGVGSFRNCSITGNTSGLYLNSTNVTDADLTGTDISGNTNYGVYADDGSLNLSAQSAEGWSIDSNGYNIYGNRADITLTSATLTNATSYGVYAEYGSLALRQSTITSLLTGVSSSHATAFTIDRCHVSGANTGSWGVFNYEGGLTMRNTVVSGAESGVYSYDTSKPATIYNSTIAGAKSYGLQADSGNLTVMNTIISGTNGTYGLYRGSSAAVTHTHNLIHGFSTPFYSTTADSTEIQKSPRFTDAAGGDYTLRKGSPAINSGVDLSASHVVDVLGNTRPSHDVFEMGAYEFMKSGGSLRVLDWQEKR